MHEAVESAYVRKAADFVKTNKKELEAAGVVICGAAAFVGLNKVGTFEKTAALLTAALKHEPLASISRRAVLGDGLLAGRAAVLRNVHTYIFDLDRTLIDTDKAFKDYSDTMHSELARATGLDPAFLHTAMKSTEARLHSLFFARRLDLIQPLQEKFPGVDLNSQFAAVATKSEAVYRLALQPSAETNELLDTLTQSGKRLILFTGGSPMHTAEKLDATGLGK